MTLVTDNPSKPHVKRWSRQEYLDLVARGFVSPDTLFYKGELVEKSPQGVLVPKLWTKREYMEKVERGFLSKQRVFLLRGELIEMASMGALHFQGVKKLTYWLVANFRPEHELAIQMPIEAFDESMPQPDGAVYSKEQESRRPCPNAALLVIEISDSSIEFDREMANEYAASNVQEYWVINVRDRNAEIYRDPISDSASETGFRFSTHQVVGESEVMAPLFRPSATVRPAEFMSTE